LNEVDEVESELQLKDVMPNGDEEDIIIQFSPPVFGQKVRLMVKREDMSAVVGLSFNYVRVYQPGTKHCSKFGGDPHLVTFDGVAYDCQGSGEFVLATSEEFKLHAQFEQVNTRPSVSTTRAVAIEVPNVPKVVVRAGSWSNGCTMTVSVGDNADVTLPHKVDGLEISGQKVSTGNSMVGVEIEYAGVKSHRVNVFMSGSSYWDCTLHVDTCVYGVDTTGLLGTPDNDPTNDWPKKVSGEFQEIPASTYDRLFEKAFDWCTDNWCVADPAKSLFESLLSCGVYDDTTENLFQSEADLGTIMDRCNVIVGRGKGNVQGGVNQCLIDFIMFKDIAQPNEIQKEDFFTAFEDEQTTFEARLPARPTEEDAKCVPRTEIVCDMPNTSTS